MRGRRAGTPAVAVLAGLLIALSVPPAGWWPLGIAGLAVVFGLLEGRRPLARAAIGLCAGIGLYGVTLWWITEFNAIGLVLLVVIEAGFLAGAALATPAGRGRAPAWVAAVVAQEWLRSRFPLGGLPMGGIALGQASGPLAPAARLGGPLLVIGVTAAAGVALASAFDRRPRLRAAGGGRGRQRPRRAVAGAVTACAVALAVAGGRASPSGRVVGTVRVAVVQGGGRRGLRAINGSALAVLQAAIDATGGVHPPVDLVLWPEDVVALDGPVLDSAVGARIGAIASGLGAPLLAGVTEDVGRDLFRNAQVVWDPSGRISDRYDKVHRVPFGEYVPGRRFLSRFVSLAAVPRDAIAGTGPGAVDTTAGRMGVVISYEVFFADRARSAINAGGEILLAPTNTASYTTTQVPASELATARLRAWETGRSVVMAAPTGFSAVIDDRGRLQQRSGLGRRQVLGAVVTRRRGTTPYLRWGDGPVLVVALGALAWGWSRRSLDRPVNSGKP